MRHLRYVRFPVLGLLALAALVVIGGGGQVAVTVAAPGAVTVREQAFDLPHIYADTDLELARENGRQTANDRLSQLILISRVARGTLFQAFSTLVLESRDNDIAARREGYTSSELNNMFAKLPADMRALVMEYARGVNDTIDDVLAGSLPMPLEVSLFLSLGLGSDLFGNATNISDQVDPFYKAPGGADPEHPAGGFQFTPEMAMAIAVLQVRSFGSAAIDESSLLDELNSLLTQFPVTGDEIWDDLNFLNDPLAPVSVPNSTAPGFGGPLAQGLDSAESPAAVAESFPEYNYAAALEAVHQQQADREARARKLGAWPAMGSYSWMIDGERSATGNPWIGGFPQTGIQTPSIMHFMEIRSGEGTDHRIQGMGMAFVGAPLILIGQTDNVAFTTTTGALKNSDLYLNRLILEDAAALRYNDEGSPAAMSMRTEIIKPTSGTATSIVVWRTHERAGNGGSRTVEAFLGDASGIVESATTTSLTDVGAFSGDYSGGYVAIVDRAGAGQIRPILSNTTNTLTLDAGDAWLSLPSVISEYVAVKPGNDIVVISRERAFWLEESTSVFGFSFFQRAESVLDIRRGVRMIPSAHNFLAADNQTFNGTGTDLGPGTGNIGYWASGFWRQRQGAPPTDTRLPLDGTVANELVLISGTVDSAAAGSLTSAGVFTGENFTPPALNFRLNNPTQQGSEYIVTITGGAGYRQTRRIASNTDNTLTLEEDWGVIPSAGDLFEVYEIVAIPEAINPPQGYTANWNNKAATADDGPFGRQHRNVFILEQLAADSSWSRDDQRQLNKDVAGLDGKGKFGRFLIPMLREAVDAVGNGGNPDVDTVLAALEAHNGTPSFGRNFIDPVCASTTDGEVSFLNQLVPRLSSAIYGDELSGTIISAPGGSEGLNLVQHAIDSAAGTPAGRYVQQYSGDYFNATDWRVVVRDTFSTAISELGGIPADSTRPDSTYAHPLLTVYSNLVFEPTPAGNRGIWEQIVEVGPVVNGEFIFPLGQSGFIDNGANPDLHFDSLHPVWRDWRFVPMLHIAEDLATDPDGDVDNDGVLDGYERWYFGSISPSAGDDADGDGATLLDEYQNGSDPTNPDTDGDRVLDGVDASPQDSGGTADGDGDGVKNVCDNCPSWPNPGQSLPPWAVPIGDPDCDGFIDADEIFIGTDPNLACSTDRWPPDFNSDHNVNVLDIVLMKPNFFSSAAEGPPYDVRFDLRPDTFINVLDINRMKPLFFLSCTP